MLKYNHQRIIGTNYHKDRKGVSVINTANVIYEKFTEQGNLGKGDDYRFLIGLGNTWGSLFPNEFKPLKLQKKERAQDISANATRIHTPPEP